MQVALIRFVCCERYFYFSHDIYSKATKLLGQKVIYKPVNNFDTLSRP